MHIPLKQYWKLISTYLKPQWPKVLFLILLLLGSTGLELFNPQLLRAFIDTATSHGSPLVLSMDALLFTGIALLLQVASVGTAYVSEQLRWATTNPLRIDLATHCLRLDMPFHNAHTPGEMIERLDGDVNTLSNFFSEFTIHLLGGLLALLGILILLFREDWRVGLTFSLFSLLMLVILALIRNLVTSTWMQERRANAELFGFLEEHLTALTDLRTNAAQAYVIHNLHRHLQTLFRYGLRAALLDVTIWSGIVNPLFLLASLGILALGSYLYLQGSVSLGTVLLFVSYIQMLRSPMDRITDQLKNLQQASAGIQRIQELYNTPTIILDGPTTTLPKQALAVEFDKVSFAYHSEKPVLRDLSFQLQPGRVLGLLGRTGSGKTTLMRLLSRLYEANSGTICLGSYDIRSIQLATLRRHVGVVTQEVQIFQATLRDNLTLFDRSIADEDILAVLQELSLERWYQALPQGLETELSFGGRGLSAGEAQLLAFARVFLKDPGLVILDEASSRLDPATEIMIERAVDRLLANRTGIIIAHHLATIQRADEILILENGSIREQGDRLQLANDPDSYFAHLLTTGIKEILT